MRISVDLDDGLVPKIKECARDDGHSNMSAVIRKALAFFLELKSRNVNPKDILSDLDKN